MDCAPPWVYIATAQAHDDEMAVRIAEHRQRRDRGWRTLEPPLDLPGAISDHGSEGPLLIARHPLWLSNVMLTGRDLVAETQRLIAALRNADGRIVIVSNEVG